MSARTACAIRDSTTCQGSGARFSVLGRQTSRMVERAAARSMMWIAAVRLGLDRPGPW